METDNDMKKPILTGDGSQTFFSEKFGQIYHSKSGGVEECREKFVMPCLELKERKEKRWNEEKKENSGKDRDKKKNGRWIPRILDICYGLGYNSAAALDILGDSEILGLEDDIVIIRAAKDINPGFKSYHLIKELAASDDLQVSSGRSSIKVLLGDARVTIKRLIKDCGARNSGRKFDIVFLHSFSIKACPELWDQEFINDIYSVMAEDSILTTYACAKVIRERLSAAGFTVRDGPVIGRRAPGTVAEKR